MKYEMDRGHIEYVRKMQDLRTRMVVDGEAQERIFKWVVRDVLEDPENRQPSFWVADGTGSVEYQSNGHVERTTLGKYIGKFWDGGEHYGATIDTVVQTMIGILGYKDKHFETLTGNEVVQMYLKGSVAPACMSGRAAYGQTHLYAENGVDALVYRNKARALLWTLDDGTKFMDRIYPNDVNVIQAYHQWAIQHGYVVRTTNTQPGEATVMGFKTPRTQKFIPVTDEHSVTVNLAENGLFPYFDTFIYCDEEPGADVLTMRMTRTVDTGRYQPRTVGSVRRCDSCRVHGVVEWFGDHQYCPDCMEDMSVCDRCESATETTYTVESDTYESEWCQSCRENYTTCCSQCENVCYDSDDYIPDDWHEFEDGSRVCGDCKDDYLCHECGNPAPANGRSTSYMVRDAYGSRTKNNVYRFCDEDCQETFTERVEEAVTATA